MTSYDQPTRTSRLKQHEDGYFFAAPEEPEEPEREALAGFGQGVIVGVGLVLGVLALALVVWLCVS